MLLLFVPNLLGSAQQTRAGSRRQALNTARPDHTCARKQGVWWGSCVAAASAIISTPRLKTALLHMALMTRMLEKRKRRRRPPPSREISKTLPVPEAHWNPHSFTFSMPSATPPFHAHHPCPLSCVPPIRRFSGRDADLLVPVVLLLRRHWCAWGVWKRGERPRSTDEHRRT